MLRKYVSSIRFAALVALTVAALAWWPARQTFAGVTEEDVPKTSVVPAGSASPSAPPPASAKTPPPAPAEAGMEPAPAPKPKPAAHHTASSKPPEVEPATARLKLIEDAWILSAPAKFSKHLERAHKDKFVVVTGATHYYLQVKLKSGETGYIEPAAVEIDRPADKVFLLTHDAAVLDKPNRWGKKVAEVHQSHNVHVVALALNYMKIRMKNGLEGYIPTTALE